MTALATLLFLLAGADDAPPAAPSPAASEVELAPESREHRVHLGVTLGTFINKYGGVGVVRVAVQPTLLRRPLNEFSALVELGAGVGYLLAGAAFFTEHYQYSAIAGAAYHSDHRTWEWGFRLGLGAVLYRSTLDRSQPFEHFQQQVVGYIEGRAQVGLAFGSLIKAGLFVGYGSPFTYQLSFTGSWVVGGLLTGFYVDFR